jgi:hypothetical protein
MMSSEQPVSHRFAAIWGTFGVMAIVLFAIVRLMPYVMTALAAGLDALHWLVLTVNVCFMAWSEGYRGFQLKFSPRVVARALYLCREPTSWGTRIMAPLFCIGYFNACGRTRVFAWAGTIGIVILVLLVHRLDQPWRGIIDAGVVVGLSWGLISLIVSALAVMRSGEYPASPKVPGYNDD